MLKYTFPYVLLACAAFGVSLWLYVSVHKETPWDHRQMDNTGILRPGFTLDADAAGIVKSNKPITVECVRGCAPPLKPCTAGVTDHCIEVPSPLGSKFPMLFPKSNSGRWNYLIETNGGQTSMRIGFRTRGACEAALCKAQFGMTCKHHYQMLDLAWELQQRDVARMQAGMHCVTPGGCLIQAEPPTSMRTETGVFLAECFRQ